MGAACEHMGIWGMHGNFVPKNQLNMPIACQVSIKLNKNKVYRQETFYVNVLNFAPKITKTQISHI